MGRLGKLAICAVAIVGILGIALGAVFIYQGGSTYSFLQTQMRVEKITLGIDTDKITAGEVIDTMGEARAAADIIREHRHGISPTYGDLLAGKRFDATNVTQLTYAQAMNLENYLYLSVAAFGLALQTLFTGVFMIVAGLALITVALVVRKIKNKTQV